jgi:hypothetical protein
MPTTVRAYTLKKTSNGYQIRWNENAISVRFDPRIEKLLTHGSVDEAAVMASEAWRGYQNVPDILINSDAPAPAGYVTNESTNGIYIVDPWPYENEKLAVTVTTYDEVTGRLYDADVYINPNVALNIISEDSKKRRSETYDFVSIITHEFGHVLGLGESEVPTATMWPQIKCNETNKRSLDQDDEDGVEAAYSGAAPKDSAGCGKASVGSVQTQPSIVVITAALTMMFLLVYRARSVQRRRIYAGILACGSVLCLGIPASESLLPADSAKTAKLASAMLSTPIAATHPDAVKRLDKLMAGSTRHFFGKTKTVTVSKDRGLIWTTVAVTSDQGDKVRLRLPGGTIDGITQQAGDEPPPENDRQLLVVPHSDGSIGWAHFSDGAIFGGSLGKGPAIAYSL